MRLVLIADTHIPKRAKDLPAVVWHEVARADVVIHAGDWVDASLLDRLNAATAQLLGCYGNNDGPDLRRRLPEVAQADLDGVRVTVVHETGGAKGREQRVAKRYPTSDLLVFGHSHIPWDTTTPTGIRLVNPGSPTDRRSQPSATFMTADLAAGRIEEVTLHRIDRPPLAGDATEVTERPSS